MNNSLIAVIAIILIAAAVIPVTAQEEDEEAKRVEELARRLEKVLPLYSFNENRGGQLNLGAMKFQFFKGPHELGTVQLRFKEGLMERLNSLRPILSVGFQKFIHNRAYGNPALDHDARPRQSLNIDPVTGWYYWEY